MNPSFTQTARSILKQARAQYDRGRNESQPHWCAQAFDSIVEQLALALARLEDPGTEPRSSQFLDRKVQSTHGKGYVIDATGNMWYWDCGWHMRGREDICLGHAAFASIPKAVRKQLGRTVRPDKPHGLFRRLVAHDAEGKPVRYHRPGWPGTTWTLESTDGKHAVIRAEDDPDEPLHTVLVAEILELPRERAPRAPRSEAKSADVAALYRLIHGREATPEELYEMMERLAERTK